MSEETIRRNDAELAAIRAIAKSGNDQPVLMLNLNRYTQEAGFPNGELYRSYMSVLEEFLPVVGGKILWRHPVYGQPVGEQKLDEDHLNGLKDAICFEHPVVDEAGRGLVCR
jgi:hypothetical protein